MNISIQTNEGKQLDITNIKYMTFDNIEYAMLPVLSKIPFPTLKKKTVSDETVDNNLNDFFNVESNTKARRVNTSSTAHKVREWLANAKPGESVVLKAPSSYAIRVACETQNVKAKIYKVKRGQFTVIYDRKKAYARAKTV